MYPAIQAQLIETLKVIAVELRVSNELTAHAAYRYSTALLPGALEEMRESLREELS